MVVGPASTLDSWKNEVAKWAPSMDAIVYRPQEEDRAETLRPFLPDRRQTGKILITSYEMVIRDTKYLKRCAWKFLCPARDPVRVETGLHKCDDRQHLEEHCPPLVLFQALRLNVHDEHLPGDVGADHSQEALRGAGVAHIEVLVDHVRVGHGVRCRHGGAEVPARASGSAGEAETN